MEKDLMVVGGGLLLGPSTAPCPRWAPGPKAPSPVFPQMYGPSTNLPGHGFQRRLERPLASLHLSVGRLGTLGCGWKSVASNLCFPPPGSMSQFPVQQQRDGCNPMPINTEMGSSPSTLTFLEGMAQQRSCKDWHRRVHVPGAQPEVQVLQRTQASDCLVWWS